MAGMTIDATGAWHNLAAFTTAKPQVTSYTYDPAGNRVSTTSGGQTTSHGYNKLDEVNISEGWTYDDNGNAAAIPGSAFGYDAANRLTSAAVSGYALDYTYDGDGKRAGDTKQVAGGGTAYSVGYVYDVAGGLPVVLADQVSGANAPPSRKYVWGPAGLAYTDAGGTVNVYHADGLGSVRAITDGGGSVVQTYRGDAYGVAVSSQGGVAQALQFAGQQRDEDGLFFLRSRVYDPTQGRFLQRDPLVGVPGLPLSLNRYSYALNNPVSRVDYSGLSTDDTLLGVLTHKLIESYFVTALKPGRGYQTEVRIPVGAWSGYRRLDIARRDTGSRVKRQYDFYEIKPDTQRSEGIFDILLDINFGRNLTPAYTLIPDPTSFPDFYIASVPEWFLHVWLDRGAPGSPAVTGLILYRWEYVPWWLPDPALGPETEPELPEPLPKQLPLPI